MSTMKQAGSSTSETLNIKYGANTLPIRYNSPNIINEVKQNGNKFFEIHMLDAISKLPYRRGICMDIGANTGNHTIFFSRFCNFDEVWSYEPNEKTFGILKQNVADHCKRTVRLFNCAIGEKKGKVNFSDLDNPAINKVIPGRGKTLVLPVTTPVKVALMKIDVEGYEKKVLKGAFAVIDRDKPELFIETHGDPKELLPLLPDGYKILKRYNNAPTFHFSFS